MDSIRCPIDTWSDSNRLAILTADRQLTYQELNFLVASYTSLPLPEQAPIAFIAEKTCETIAFIFALWRRQRLALPLSPRLPKEGILAALKATKAHFITPVPLTNLQKSPTLYPDSLSTLLFTSGTTKAPKIACHTLANHLHSAKSALTLLHLQPDDRYALDLPLNHVGGLAVCLRTFLAGATLLLPPFPTNLEPTHLSLVPTQLLRLLRQNALPKNAKCLLIGGAPLSSTLLQAALAKDLPIYQSYAMTETSALIALQPPFGPTCISTAAELKIEEGEIYVRGPQLFQGYFSLEGLELPLINGWFATRDLGRFSLEGKLEWLGRKDRQFTSGGENIQPEEIEAALLELPFVLEAHIKPVADEELGQRITAHLVLDKEIPFKEIEQLLRKSLPGYKIPKEWHMASELRGKQ